MQPDRSLETVSDVSLSDHSTLPDFITFDKESVSFEVYTDITGDAANYELAVIISFPDFPDISK